jgi:hypothetical protein
MLRQSLLAERRAGAQPSRRETGLQAGPKAALSTAQHAYEEVDKYTSVIAKLSVSRADSRPIGWKCGSTTKCGYRPPGVATLLDGVTLDLHFVDITSLLSTPCTPLFIFRALFVIGHKLTRLP